MNNRALTCFSKKKSVPADNPRALLLIEGCDGLWGINGSIQSSCPSQLLNLSQDWPSGDMEIKHELLHCSSCGTKLCLVAQVSIVDSTKCVLLLGHT
jgi:hypothetical protein